MEVSDPLLESLVLYRFHPWLVALILAMLFLAAAELGYRIGGRQERQVEATTQQKSMQNAVLALLALLLAFTFAAAADRYEGRRAQVVDEANALGAAYLRAQTLPEPYQTRATGLLREYVDVQLDYFSIRRPEAMDALNRQTDQLHDQLWTVTAEVARANPDSEVAARFMATINEIIDLQTTRLALVSNRVPESVWVVLIAIALFEFFLIGFINGLRTRRNLFVVLIVAIIIALVVGMNIDFDRPLAGFIQVSPRPLIDLRATMGN